MDDVLHKNPINWSTVKLWSAVSGFGFIAGNLLVIAEHGFSWLGVVIGLVLALVVLIYVPWRLEFLWRPTAVEIVNDGVVLHQRYGRKPLFVSLSDIKMLNLAMVDNDRRNWWTMDGALFVDGGKNYYHVNWRIAIEIREAYRVQMGRYPINQSEIYTKGPAPSVS